MCNSLMKGKWEACPDQHQYHAMVCRSSTHTCLKIDGNQTVVNNTAEGNKITSTIGKVNLLRLHLSIKVTEVTDHH